MEGSYYIEVEVYAGSIEKIVKGKQDGQTVFTISGRSDIRKLLGPTINKNTYIIQKILFTQQVAPSKD